MPEQAPRLKKFPGSWRRWVIVKLTTDKAGALIGKKQTAPGTSGSATCSGGSSISDFVGLDDIQMEFFRALYSAHTRPDFSKNIT